MKDNEEIKIPPFVQDYLDKMQYEGYEDFAKLSQKYQKEREDYPEKFGKQSAFLKDYNTVAGKNHQLNYDDGLKEIDERYKNKAYQTAKQNGYKGPDPNAPSDKEFTKQGEKFQDMINNAKERKNQPEKPQQEQANDQPLDREQLRAEFLEKMKQTKEQISQKQHEQGHER